MNNPNDPDELAAQAVYKALKKVHDGFDRSAKSAPNWVKGGNSSMQVLARRTANTVALEYENAQRFQKLDRSIRRNKSIMSAGVIIVVILSLTSLALQSLAP
tara:strand:- start:76 stop:381 length:306 start_codon:yes stop_codon:yes gene_type:complete